MKWRIISLLKTEMKVLWKATVYDKVVQVMFVFYEYLSDVMLASCDVAP